MFVIGFDFIFFIYFVYDEFKLVFSVLVCFNILNLYVNEIIIYNFIYRYFVIVLMNGGIVSKI